MIEFRPADATDKPKFRVVQLSWTRVATKLLDNLDCRNHTATAGVAERQEAAACIRRKPPADSEGSSFDERAAFSLLAETGVLERDYHRDREVIGHPGEVHLLWR